MSQIKIGAAFIILAGFSVFVGIQTDAFAQWSNDTAMGNGTNATSIANATNATSPISTEEDGVGGIAGARCTTSSC